MQARIFAFDVNGNLEYSFSLSAEYYGVLQLTDTQEYRVYRVTGYPRAVYSGYNIISIHSGYISHSGLIAATQHSAPG